jgi:hypothetical protein
MYVVVVSVPFFVENAGHTPDKDTDASKLQALSTFALGAPLRYEDVTQLGFRRPMPHLVQIVAVGKNKPIDFSTAICARRLFLARVLEKIEDTHPSLIVLDIYFPEQLCPAGDPGTEALRKAIATSKTPVVAALETYTPSEYAQLSRGENKPPGLPLVSERQFETARAARLVLGRDLDFQTGGQAHTPGNLMLASAGLIRISSDIRQIPLRWPIYDVQTNGDLGDVRLMRTLSLVAAQSYEKEVSNGSVSARLAGLVESGTFPYITNFVPEKTADTDNGIPVTDALELLCGKLAQAGDWTRCKAGTGGDLVSLAPIVVVGQQVSSDIHPTPIGLMHGYAIQANYIEALLEERYITPMSQRSALFLNIGWVVLVELIFFFWTPRLALMYALLASVIILVLTYFVLLQWGFFLVLWTLALAIFSPVIRALEEVKHILAHPAGGPRHRAK